VLNPSVAPDTLRLRFDLGRDRIDVGRCPRGNLSKRTYADSSQLALESSADASDLLQIVPRAFAWTAQRLHFFFEIADFGFFGEHREFELFDGELASRQLAFDGFELGDASVALRQ